MKRKWRILYYETKDGECPVRKFIDARNDREQAKIFAWLSQLEEKGPNLHRPFADLLTDGIHELRIRLSGEESTSEYCISSAIVTTLF